MTTVFSKNGIVLNYHLIDDLVDLRIVYLPGPQILIAYTNHHSLKCSIVKSVIIIKTRSIIVNLFLSATAKKAKDKTLNNGILT